MGVRVGRGVVTLGGGAGAVVGCGGAEEGVLGGGSVDVGVLVVGVVEVEVLEGVFDVEVEDEEVFDVEREDEVCEVEVSVELSCTGRSSTGAGSAGEAATRKPSKTSSGTQTITARRIPSRPMRRRLMPTDCGPRCSWP